MASQRVLFVSLVYVLTQCDEITCALPKFSSPKFNSSLLYCVHNVSHQYKYLSGVSFLIEEVRKYVLVQLLLQEMDLPIILDQKLVYTYTLHLLFGNDSQKYVKLLQQVKVAKKPLFLVVWQWPNRVVEEPDVLDSMLKQFQQFNFMNVFILVERYDNHVYLYTYFPYTAEHCSQVGRPRLINVWNSSSQSFQMNYNFDSINNKISNMHGCPLRFAVRNRPPDSIIIPTNKNKYHFGGTSGLVLHVMINKLNVTPQITLIENSTNRDEFGYSLVKTQQSVCCDNLFSGTQDFVVGIFSLVLYHTSDIDFSSAIFSECFMFYAPCRAGQSPSYWSQYYREFSLLAWILMILFFLVSVICMALIAFGLPYERKAFQSVLNNVIFLLGICLNISVYGKEQSHSMRILSLHLLLAFIVICGAYQGSLKSFMSVPVSENDVKSWEEIDKRNFRVVGLQLPYTVLSRVTSDSAVLQNLANRYLPTSTGFFEDVVDEVITRRDAVVFGPERILTYYSRHRRNSTAHPACPVGSCVTQSYGSPFMMPKGSPFTETVNKITRQLFESGITEKWWTSQVSKLRRIGDGANVNMTQLLSAFVLLSVGLCVSACVFVLELIFYKIF